MCFSWEIFAQLLKTCYHLQACWGPSIWGSSWKLCVFVWERLQCAETTSKDYWGSTCCKYKIHLFILLHWSKVYSIEKILNTSPCVMLWEIHHFRLLLMRVGIFSFIAALTWYQLWPDQAKRVWCQDVHFKIHKIILYNSLGVLLPFHVNNLLKLCNEMNSHIDAL